MRILHLSSPLLCYSARVAFARVFKKHLAIKHGQRADMNSGCVYRMNLYRMRHNGPYCGDSLLKSAYYYIFPQNPFPVFASTPANNVLDIPA